MNDKVARELKVERGKCVPHALALVVKAVALGLPLICKLTLKTGSLIFAGGSTRRKRDLQARGLLPRSMVGYANRFMSLVEVCVYNARNFDSIAQWVQSLEAVKPAGKKVAAAAPAEKSSSDSDSDGDDSSDSQESDSEDGSDGSDSSPMGATGSVDDAESSSDSDVSVNADGETSDTRIASVKEAWKNPFARLEMEIVRVRRLGGGRAARV